MPDLDNFRRAVTHRCLESLDGLVPLAESPGQLEALREMLAPARSLLAAGKRTRALLLLAGYLCGESRQLDSPIRAGSALELYQLSALIHDDLMDDSPTRRGMPAAHIAFAEQLGVSRQSECGYGMAGAITLGDMLLSHSVTEFLGALTSQSRKEALATFTQMTSEVAYGQFLDIRAEYREASIDDAFGIVRHKSARYSVELPLVIGAQLAGAPRAIDALLRDVGGPLGEAFQLRDDDLGIFGESGLTGKPECGDITEGKNTVLLALIRELAPRSDVEWIESLKGQPMSAPDVTRVRTIAVESGARARHEALIRESETRAVAAWERLPASEGRSVLHSVMQQLERRSY